MVYIGNKANLDFEQFAKTIFSEFEIVDVGFRYGDKHSGGKFASARALGITLVIEEAEDHRFYDYDYLLTSVINNAKDPRESAERERSNKGIIESLADYVACVLALRGYDIARDPDGGIVGARKLVYTFAEGKVVAKDETA
jgi:hypothetical protein